MQLLSSKDFEGRLEEESGKFNRNWTRIFHLICSISAFSLTCWCIYKYMKDEDVSLVNYKRYHSDKNSIYPSLTLCFNNPFLNDRLENFGKGINTTTYSKFLKGLHWDERMVDINYDNVTLDINQHLEEAKVVLANGTVYNHKGAVKNYIVVRSSYLKCFSFDPPFLPNVGVEYLVVVLKNSIFPNGYRPTHHNFDVDSGVGSGFEVRFNYPRQVFRSDFTAKWIWEDLGNNASQKWVGMTFKVKNIEVLRRRSKYAFPCNNDWTHDDDKIMENIAQTIQCTPSHWDLNNHENACSQGKLRKLTDLLNDDWGSPKKGKYPSPCQNIENLSYDYSEKSGMDSRRDARLMVLVHFPNRKFRQITHVQEYDIESMVGNIGGYIGLFLGYSFLHFPRFLMGLWQNRKSIKPLTKVGKKLSKSSEQKSTNEANGQIVNEEVKCISCAKLKDINQQFFVLTERMKKLETNVKNVREDFKSSKPTTLDNNMIKKVRVTEWNNSVSKADYNV